MSWANSTVELQFATEIITLPTYVSIAESTCIVEVLRTLKNKVAFGCASNHSDDTFIFFAHGVQFHTVSGSTWGLT